MSEDLQALLDDSEETQLLEFIDEYNKSEDIKKVSMVSTNMRSKIQSIRLFCAKKLTDLGKLLGIPRIDDEIIPFITDLILNYEDDGEVLSEFSNQLLNLLIILKENNKFSFIGIRSLEILAGNDDEIVRQTSIKNILKLIELLDEDYISSEIFPLMKRLIDNDLKTKMSCCYLFPAVYSKLKDPSVKKELLQVYYDISQEDPPSVRRAAADNIKFFCNVNDPEVISLLIKLYNKFIVDKVDIVKIHTIESTKSLLEKISPDMEEPVTFEPKKENETTTEEDKTKEPKEQNAREKLVFSFTTSMCKEKGWRVKYAAAECISQICEIFTQQFFETNFVPLLLIFLKDKEAEVKCAVLTFFDKYFEYLSLDKFKEQFLKIFTTLASDTNLHVRSVFACTILKCLPFFKKDEQLMSNDIMPLLTKLLKDEIVEVQYAAIENLDKIILLPNDDVDIINKYIIPIIQEGMTNKKWRFRYLVAENLSKVVGKLPKDKLMNTFFPIITQLFSDHAAEIRKEAWKIIEEIEKNVYKNFIYEKIWDIQKEKMSSKNYILRIASMKSVDYLKQYYQKNDLKDIIIPFIVESVKKDKVPNVKFSACEVLASLVKHLGKEATVKKMAEDFISSLTNDIDEDVVFFSKKAIQDLKN
jgi:serine/threonine-protein phosphatase 2A regulatory subunit A